MKLKLVPSFRSSSPEAQSEVYRTLSTLLEQQGLEAVGSLLLFSPSRQLLRGESFPRGKKERRGGEGDSGVPFLKIPPQVRYPWNLDPKNAKRFYLFLKREKKRGRSSSLPLLSLPQRSFLEMTDSQQQSSTATTSSSSTQPEAPVTSYSQLNGPTPSNQAAQTMLPQASVSVPVQNGKKRKRLQKVSLLGKEAIERDLSRNLGTMLGQDQSLELLRAFGD